MNMHIPTTLLLLGALASGAIASPNDPADDGKVKEIGRTTEKELNVVMSSSFGTVVISRGESGKVLVAESERSAEGSSPATFDYAIRNRTGFLDIQLGEAAKRGEGKKKSFRVEDFDKGKWYLRFTDAIPVSFDVELGVGRGDFNLSGLQVKDFNLTTGASDVTLAFDAPNTSTIENLNIESGVSKFDGRNLCNANFRRLTFQGGVGTYTLDFGGTLQGEVDVDVEVGLGLLTIIIPEEIGARVTYEKSWASRLDCDRDFRESGSDRYESENYSSASAKMNIAVDSGLGSIKIRRR